MSPLFKFPRFILLPLLISIGTVSAVFFTPGLPLMAQEFGLSESQRQWPMTIFLLGYCLGQLPYGPIANRIGRKKTIYLGLIVIIIGSLIVYLSKSFGMVLFGRFIQSLGGAMGLKVTFTMIADLHAGPAAARMIGYIALGFPIVQGLGIALGGFITESYGWRGCFLFLIAYFALLLVSSITLPETSKAIDKSALEMRKIAHGYKRQFTDWFLTSHGWMMGLCTACLYIFTTEAPSLVIDGMGLSPAVFGLYSLIPVFGYALGMYISGRLSGKVVPRIGMIAGILFILLGALLFALSGAQGWGTPATFFLFGFVVYFGATSPWVNASAVGLSEATDKSNASAVMQFYNVGGTLLGTFLVGAFLPINAFTLPIAFGAIAFLLIILWLSLKTHHDKRGHS